MAMKKVAIVIPSFNEGERVLITLKEISQYLLDAKNPNWKFEFVVIDDASHVPLTINEELEDILPFSLIRHPINLGQGASLATGFQYCRNVIKPDFILTMDADGQHSVESIFCFLDMCFEKKLDIIFGNRFATHSNVPFIRKIVLKLAKNFEYILSGLNLSDAHNGFRVLNAKALDLMYLNQNRMAHATEIKLLTAKHRLKYGEAPCLISYTSESLQKGQSSLGSVAILRDLFKNYLFDR